MNPARIRIYSILLLMSLLISCNPLAVNAVFSDLAGHWSQEAILTSVSFDLIKGYPDQSFKPEQALSQLEALVLFMKSQGYALDKVVRPKKGAAVTRNPAIPVVPWGQNYLDTAYEKQLLPPEWSNGFKYNAPATRGQVAVLLGRLLNLPNTEAAAAENEPAIFSDLTTSSPEARAYIAVLNKQGIINGFADGTFRPEQALKRSEAAVLLTKLIQGNWIKSTANQGSQQMEGWIKSLTKTGKKAELELATLQGVQKLKIDPDLKCFRNGQECFYQDAVNSQVRLYLNKKKQVAVISLLDKISSGGSDDYIVGTVKSVVLGEESLLVLCDLDSKDRRLSLAQEATLESLKTQTKGFQALKNGSFVKAYLNNNKVVKVSELATQNTSGTVMKLSARTLNLEDKKSSSSNKSSFNYETGYAEETSASKSKNKATWFNYWDRARIIDKDGKRMGSVVRGDKVKVTYLDPISDGIDDEIPLEIIITSRPDLKKVKGVIESIVATTGSKAIVVKKNKNYPADEAITVADAVYGTAIPFVNLKADNEIEMHVDGAGVVMKALFIK